MKWWWNMTKKKKFKKGDRVRLVRKHRTWGWYGLESLKGQEFVVYSAGFDEFEFKNEGRSCYTGFYSMFDKVKLSRFENKVRRYIQAELGNAS